MKMTRSIKTNRSQKMWAQFQEHLGRLVKRHNSDSTGLWLRSFCCLIQNAGKKEKTYVTNFIRDAP